ncbi:IS5 family transposase [Roseovarius sp. MBR-79]|jgi:IS5 family transposase
MRKALRRLKGYTGRVLRDIERQMDKVAEGPLKLRLQDLVALAKRLLAQKPKDRKKLYSLHEPAVDCISKGKVHKRYEFGTKITAATTTEGGFVVGMRSLQGNPYDGHTLHEALEQVETLTDQRPDMAFVDRGYRGHPRMKPSRKPAGTRALPRARLKARKRSQITCVSMFQQGKAVLAARISAAQRVWKTLEPA